jgi:hypothetical protein
MLHFIKTNVVVTTQVVLLLVLLPLLPLSGLCQPDPVQTEKPSETIEEVIVRGSKSLIELKHEMYRAEDTLYDLFNSVNIDDQFDIRCYEEAPTGSKLKVRVCKTNYFRNRHAAETQKLMRGEPFMYPVFGMKKMDERLNELMTKAILEQPKMLDVLARYAEAKQTLESERKHRCGGRFLICRRQ